MKFKIFNIAGLKLDVYAQLAIFVLVIIVITGVFSNQIATSRPLYYKYKNEIYFPTLSRKIDRELATMYPAGVDWSAFKGEPSIIFAPIPYDPGASDFDNSIYQKPFAKNKNVNARLPFRHWLGTNLKGDDVLSGIIHGSTVSLKIGFFSVLIALSIGVILGLVAGYYQNDTVKIPLLSGIFMIIGFVASIYLADITFFFMQSSFQFQDTKLFLAGLFAYGLTLMVSLTLTYQIGKWCHRLFKINKKVHLQIDSIVSKILEIFTAIPKLILIVALAAILERSVTNIILIIGLCSWPGIARLVRAETMKTRSQDFIMSAKAMGLQNFYIMIKHILPNITAPIIVSFVFGISGAILIESGLSFLNIGVPENVITWGQLLADGRRNFSAWWLIVFPGLAVFTTIFCLNILGEKFKSILDPRNRNFN